MTRDEILAMANEAGVLIPNLEPYASYVETFANLAYAAGQRDMQEMAAKCVSELVSMRVPASKYTAAIRNLEVA